MGNAIAVPNKRQAMVDPLHPDAHNPVRMRFLLPLGYLAIPLAFLVHFWLRSHGPPAWTSWEPALTFALSGFGLIPMAYLMGRATEELAEKAGPTWGGLLNATFGNAAELIIAIIALSRGLNDIVKSTLTGSILGNLLLVSGGAMIVGGWNRERQRFSREAAQTHSGLLVVAVTAMLFPAIFHYSFKFSDPQLIEHEIRVSIGTGIILLLVYVLGLVFALKTHRHIFSLPPATGPEDPMGISGLDGGWTVRKSILVLLAASVGVAILSELLVGSVELAALKLGWNRVFIGVVLLAIFGNAAEHSTALVLARRNDMDTAMSITYQSSLQIALFVTPVLVVVSGIIKMLGFHDAHPLDMIFTPMEVAAVLLTAAVVVVVGLNGESNWFEGVMLLGVYAILGITFFYIPMPRPVGYDKGATGRPVQHAPAVQQAPAAAREPADAEGMSYGATR
jgi:Ca2+:H+ antiporter